MPQAAWTCCPQLHALENSSCLQMRCEVRRVHPPNRCAHSLHPLLSWKIQSSTLLKSAPFNTPAHQSSSPLLLFFPNTLGCLVRGTELDTGYVRLNVYLLPVLLPHLSPTGCNNLLTSVPSPFCSGPSSISTWGHFDKALVWLLPSSDCRNCHYAA